MKETFYFSHDYNPRSDTKIKRLLARHGMMGYGIYWSIIEDLYNNTNVLQTDYDCIAFDLRTDAEVIRSIINDFNLFEIKGECFGSPSVERRLNARDAKSQKARESVQKRWKNEKKNTNVLPTKNDTNTIKESKVKESKVNTILLEKESKHSLSNNITLEEKKAKIFEKNNERKAAMHGGSDLVPELVEGTHQTNASNAEATAPTIPNSPYGDGILHHRAIEWSRANVNKYEAELFKDFLTYWTAPVQKGPDKGRELWKTKLTFEIGQRLATWAKNEKQSNQNGNKTNTTPADYLTKTARDLEAIFSSPNSVHHPHG